MLNIRAVLLISSLIAYTHFIFIGHKIFFQYVANYGQPEALADNKKIASADNHYFFS